MTRCGAPVSLMLAGAVSILASTSVEAAIANSIWTHEIRRDAADGIVTCTVQKQGAQPPFPWFFFRGGSGMAVAVVGSMSLGVAQTFRVDAKPPVSEGDRLTGARARQLIAQILAGGEVLRADFVRFPSNRPDSFTVELAGIAEHLEACKAATWHKAS